MTQHEGRPRDAAGDGDQPMSTGMQPAAPPHDVLRGAALEDHRVADDVDEDRRGRPRDAGFTTNQEPRERPDRARARRSARGLISPVAVGLALRAVHHLVDVTVQVAVEDVGRAGRRGTADERRARAREASKPPCARIIVGSVVMARFDHARLGEREVRGEHAADASGRSWASSRPWAPPSGCARGRRGRRSGVVD